MWQVYQSCELSAPRDGIRGAETDAAICQSSAFGRNEFGFQNFRDYEDKLDFAPLREASRNDQKIAAFAPLLR